MHAYRTRMAMLGPLSRNLEDIGGLWWEKNGWRMLKDAKSIYLCMHLQHSATIQRLHHRPSQPFTTLHGHPQQSRAFRLALLERLTASSWLWSSAMVFTKSSLSSSKARISWRGDSNPSVACCTAAVSRCVKPLLLNHGCFGRQNSALLVFVACFSTFSNCCNMERMQVLFDDVSFFVDFFKGVGHLIVVALDAADHQGQQKCSAFNTKLKGTGLQ